MYTLKNPGSDLKGATRRGYKKKNIKDESNSGELKVGMDIPFKTVWIVARDHAQVTMQPGNRQ